MKGDIELAPGVVAHPHICSGAPCIAGHRIATAWIVGRWGAGDSIDAIADDYEGVIVPEIEAAIRYEYLRRKKRKPEFRARLIEP